MNRALRQDYLHAIGIDSWVRRGAALAAVPEVIVPPAAAIESEIPASVAHPVEPALARRKEAPGAPANRRALIEAEREQGIDWPALQARVAACQRCPLHATRTQTVFGVGSRQAQWLVVGEAPGAEEDARGEPFVGRAGQLLNSMLRAVGLAREEVYIANVLKCRPPGNRDPAPAEATECLPYLEQQIALLKPKIMLAVGRIAAQNLLRTDSPLGRLRQQVHRFGHSQVPLIATYHPAYLLRTPTDKRKAWEDLKFAREVCTRV
jgi:uracil-DNA glycosylase family 4